MRGHVIVPNVMMDELLVPDDFSSLNVEADQRVGIESGSGTMPSVAVIGRRLGRQINVSQLVIGRDRSPHADVARIVRGSVQPGLISRFAFARYSVEHPEFLSSANVER